MRVRRNRPVSAQTYDEAISDASRWRNQAERLKAVIDADREAFAEERREWKRREDRYVAINHDLAAKLCAADAQLIAWGASERES